jgi:hypothetical protein
MTGHKVADERVCIPMYYLLSLCQDIEQARINSARSDYFYQILVPWQSLQSMSEMLLTFARSDD